MEKLGVEEQKDTDKLEKAASEGCPRCGRKIERHGEVWMCPQCGTEPFER